MMADTIIRPLEMQAACPHFPLAELDDFENDLLALPGSTFRVALLIPMCGAAGIWAPSCIASAQVAVAELNQSDGICGRPVELVMIDSAVEAPTPVEQVVDALLTAHAVDAIVGMHISAVRQRLRRIVRQRVPYVYTPLYEGGERTLGIFAIGDTPQRQLGPALQYFGTERRARRWALIGNDYVWPRASHDYAKQRLRALGAELSLERYLPFGLADMTSLVEELKRNRADAVLLSLVGQDAVTFNRTFGAADLHDRMLRFSCAIEENCLLACGANNLKGLYSAASYFGSLQTPANCVFRESYHSLHGDTAPVLNALGQSTYEGLQFLAGLLTHDENEWRHQNSSAVSAMDYRSVRRDRHPHSSAVTCPVYLARADGVHFDIFKKL